MRPMRNSAPLQAKAFDIAMANFSGGTVLEFGVYGGENLGWYSSMLNEVSPESVLMGFDAWKGLPAETPGVFCPDCHSEGSIAGASKEHVLQMLADDGLLRPNTKLVEGWFKDTLTPELAATIHNLAFVSIDVYLHSSTIEVLNFIWPLLQTGTVIWWDDWNAPQIGKTDGEYGESRAWYEWIEVHTDIYPREIQWNEMNQRYFVMRKSTS